MTLLLLQGTPGDYSQWGIAGAIVLLVLAFLGFCLRALPSWKEVKAQDKDVKLAEIAVREKEAEARAAQAAGFGQLSAALSSMSGVLENVTIKQKEATDKVLLLTRVNAQASETNDEKLDLVIEHIDSLTKRMESVEKAIKGRNDNGPQAKNASPTT